MRIARACGLAVLALLASWTDVSVQSQAQLSIRGHMQTLRVYGARGGDPVVVLSGDGGWIHLAPHVAEMLAARGYFVVGLDTRGYLESFTSKAATLDPSQEPADMQVLADFAGRGAAHKPVLIGVSEGAGLAVLAATDAGTRARIAGVIGLGLPDINELGWRWRDAIIYVTHAAPKEPSFSTAAVVAKVAPTPLAAIHSTKDEFVPLVEVERVLASAREPKRLWVVPAGDHHFSDNLPEFDRRLVEALAWIGEHAAP